MYYAGIGSRKIAPDTVEILKNIATKLAKLGFVLRSGGACGADSAFEKGCDEVYGDKEIWLPYKNFNTNLSKLILATSIPEEVVNISKSIYTPWNSASEIVKRLHARNVYQILGEDLHTPVDFVVCWTDRPDTDVGGTQFGIHLAKMKKIPTYNLFKFSESELFSIMLNKLGGL